MAVVFNPFTGDFQYLNSGGSSQITQVTSDPSSPQSGDVWVLVNGSAGSAGQAMGILGLTYSRTEATSYQFSIKLANGDIKRIGLI